MSGSVYMVYHYCTVDTFKNIMSSKVLWLSNLKDSNDEQEVERTFVNLWKGVKNRLKQTDLPNDILNQAITLIDRQYRVELMTDPPYGICFCKKEDLLSQWREYGDNTQGLSLGFDINWFTENGIRKQMPHPSAIQSNTIGWDEVIYHFDKFEDKMSNLCYQELVQSGAQDWIMDIRSTFKRYSGFVKNPTFESEKEIRIVYYPTEDLNFLRKDIDVSELKNNVRKHYEIPWVKDDTQALKSICIGRNCTMTKDEIKEVLKSNGLNTNVEIKESKCSYRQRK